MLYHLNLIMSFKIHKQCQRENFLRNLRGLSLMNAIRLKINLTLLNCELYQNIF
jgi:hypothetical protein